MSHGHVRCLTDKGDVSRTCDMSHGHFRRAARQSPLQLCFTYDSHTNLIDVCFKSMDNFYNKSGFIVLSAFEEEMLDIYNVKHLHQCPGYVGHRYGYIIIYITKKCS